MKIKKIISFLLMLTLLFTTNIAPGFANGKDDGNGNGGNSKRPEIQVVFQGNIDGSVLITGEDINKTFTPTSTESLYLDEGKNIKIEVIPGSGNVAIVFEVQKESDKIDVLPDLEYTINDIQSDKYIVRVKFVKAPSLYTVTGVADPEIGGNVTGGKTVESGGEVTLTAEPNTDYRFVRWEEGEEELADESESITIDGNKITISNITSDRTITAIFEQEEQEEPEKIYYTITTDTTGTGSGTISVEIDGVELITDDDGRTYSGIEPGARVTTTATPDEGSEFAGWLDASIIDKAEYIIESIGDDHTLTAVFDKIDSGGSQEPGDDGNEEPEDETPPSNPGSSTTYYTLTVEIEGPGSMSPVGGSYARGRTITLNPTADEGAQFVGWFGADGDDVSDTNRILMNGSKSVIARFELIPPSDEEEFEDEDTPESGEVIGEDEIILDESVPQDGDILPQTSGIPIELMVGAGFALITGGIALRRKKEDEEE